MKKIGSEKEQNVIHLETERLLLRNIMPSDKEFVIKLWTDAEVTSYMGGPRTREQMIKGVEENLENPFAEEYDLWPLIDKTTNEPIGHCGLLMKEVEGNNEVEVVYVIDQSCWGKGYATEAVKMLIDYAFTTKKLKRVIALIKPDNKGSEVVAIRNDMHLEREITRQNNIKMYLYTKERDV